MQIVLEFGETAIPVQVSHRRTAISKHSGRQLEILLGETVVRRADLHHALTELINQRGNAGVPSRDAAGQPRGTWRVRQQSYSSTTSPGSPTTYRHTLELEEFEMLTPERLIVGSLELTPYAYEERVEKDGLLIDAKVRLAEDVGRALRDLLRRAREYHEVRRPGISDEPRRMRFGLTLWSKHDGEEKYDLHLVEESFDQPGAGPKLNIHPELPGIRTTVADHVGILNGLTDLLVGKGIIGRDEMDAIAQRAREEIWERAFDFFRMEDIDLE